MTVTSPSIHNGESVGSVGVDPSRIMEIATGYMASKQLFAASRTGLFRALGRGPRSVPQLAADTGLSEKVVRQLADAMNSLGLLDRHDGAYELAPDAASYLAGGTGLDLTSFLTFLNEISYEHWLQFDLTVDTTTPGDLRMDDARWSTFMSGVMTYNALHASMLAGTFDFSPYRSLLDLGGLTPAFSIAALQGNPALSARLVFAPEMGDAGEATGAAGVGDRVVFDPQPTETADPGGEHDLVMLNHVVHRFDDAQNRDILARARASATEGATLLLLDFFLDDDGRQRRLDALHASEYLVIDGTVVWPQDEVHRWMDGAGWRPQRTIDLPGSPRVIVAEAV